MLTKSLVGFGASLAIIGSALAGTPGLNGPVAIGPYLNNAFPALEPSTGSAFAVQETFLSPQINLPMHIAPYPGTNKLICVAKEGKIFTFDNVAAGTGQTLFLDLASTPHNGFQMFTNSDSGATWMVFHPEFGQAGSPNRGYVYVSYKCKPVGAGIAAGNNEEAYWRVSRFNVADGTQVADINSEQVLIQQYDRQMFHDSGCMQFINGYLYIGIGDEGGANDEFHVGQLINDRLFSGILRIDVDNKATSHAIRRQPQQLGMPAGWPASFTANYKIPNDNPFLDTGGGVLEEFYCIGVRQPYRFSYDAPSGKLWLADSGQDTREEIDIVTPGANFGWPYREGKIARPKNAADPFSPNPALGAFTEPVWDVAHTGVGGTDNCIVGGFVYRGAALPELVGKYLTVDNVTGHIRAHTLSVDGLSSTSVIIAGMPSGSVYNGASTIGQDAAGEPIFVKINGVNNRGRFYKLAAVALTAPTRSAWFRFDDPSSANIPSYVGDNPGNTTMNSLVRGIPLVVDDDEITNSANVTYVPNNGINPTGFPTNLKAVHVEGGDGDGYPGNAQGAMTTSAKLGVLNDFTAEISFKPTAGSLAQGGYRAFLGLDGLSGTVGDGKEDGPNLQPLRLMRWGRNDNNATIFPLTNGDLFFNVRSQRVSDGTWHTVPIRLLTAANFTDDKWYHLAIIGNVAAGTITVYSYDSVSGQYTQLGQGSDYVGNLQSNIWSIGRGMYAGNQGDYVASTDFDEFRITDTALPLSNLLYGTSPYVPVIPVADPPALLSQTGAFSNLANLTPAPGIVPYVTNAPLWSDRAEKLRWIAIPNDGVHDSPAEKITFKPEGNWVFPPGTVTIKHFALPVDDNDPSILRRLETRFVVVPPIGEPYGFTYKWRPDGLEADLQPGGSEDPITITTVGGGTRTETWSFPSRSDCRLCHNSNATYMLGVKTNQLNGDEFYPLTGRTANQIETMGALGWFDNTYRADLIPWMLQSKYIGDTTTSLTERVRSYLDSNCSHCHQPNGVRGNWDGRFTTPLEEQGIVNGPLLETLGDPLNRVIAPGDPARSIMLMRMASLGALKMPPIAKHLVDPRAVTLMTDWINSLGTGPAVTLTGPATTMGTFQVAVHFTQNVTGLTASDFDISGGTAAGLTGSGADYVLTVNISTFNRVTINLPAGVAQNIGAAGNYAALPYTQIVEDTPAFVDPNGLLGWYRMDEPNGVTANDTTQVGTNDGTLLGVTLPTWGVGKFGGGLDFNNPTTPLTSRNSRVEIANTIGGNFTISFWMKTSMTFPVTTRGYQGAALFFSDVGGNASDFIISGTRATGTTGVNRITVMTGNGTAAVETNIQGTTAVNDGLWKHVVVTRAQASGEVKIYINGTLTRTANGGTTVLNANPVISMGASTGGDQPGFVGSLDEVQIYNRVITQAEVTGLLSGPPAIVTPVTLVAPSSAYDDWTKAWFPGLFHLQGNKNSGLDVDNDGISNFGEFAFGVNPQVHDFVNVPINKASAASPVVLSYRALKNKAGSGYKVMVSDQLTGWADATPNITNTSAVDIPGSDYETVTITYTPPSGTLDKQFFRIQASQQ